MQGKFAAPASSANTNHYIGLNYFKLDGCKGHNSKNQLQR